MPEHWGIYNSVEKRFVYGIDKPTKADAVKEFRKNIRVNMFRIVTMYDLFLKIGLINLIHFIAKKENFNDSSK